MAEKQVKTEVKQEQKTEQKAERPRGADNVVFVSQKPAMAYVLAVMTQLSAGQNQINIKARGRAISRAVDVAEIVRNRFAKDTKIKEIKIGTDKIKTQEGKEINVSSIDIALTK